MATAALAKPLAAVVFNHVCKQKGTLKKIHNVSAQRENTKADHNNTRDLP